jgi:hypothetical protein
MFSLCAKTVYIFPVNSEKYWLKIITVYLKQHIQFVDTQLVIKLGRIRIIRNRVLTTEDI